MRCFGSHCLQRRSDESGTENDNCPIRCPVLPPGGTEPKSRILLGRSVPLNCQVHEQGSSPAVTQCGRCIPRSEAASPSIPERPPCAGYHVPARQLPVAAKACSRSEERRVG